MSIARSELVRWIRRYEAADRRIAAERRARRMDPDDALSQALGLALLAEECGESAGSCDPTDEDRRVYESWALLRRRWCRPHD